MSARGLRRNLNDLDYNKPNVNDLDYVKPDRLLRRNLNNYDKPEIQQYNKLSAQAQDSGVPSKLPPLDYYNCNPDDTVLSTKLIFFQVTQMVSR